MPSRPPAGVQAELAKLPKVQGSGAGQPQITPELVRVLDAAQQAANKAGDEYVAQDRLLVAIAASDTPAARALRAAGATPAGAGEGGHRHPQGPQGRFGQRRGELRRPEEIRPRHHRAGARRQAGPGDRPRRGNPPHHPGARAPHQEQPGADRRARRRQDRHRRGPGHPHGQRRRAGGAEEQAAAVARPRRDGRRLEVSAASSRNG